MLSPSSFPRVMTPEWWDEPAVAADFPEMVDDVWPREGTNYLVSVKGMVLLKIQIWRTCLKGPRYPIKAGGYIDCRRNPPRTAEGRRDT